MGGGVDGGGIGKVVGGVLLWLRGNWVRVERLIVLVWWLVVGKCDL